MTEHEELMDALTRQTKALQALADSNRELADSNRVMVDFMADQMAEAEEKDAPRHDLAGRPI
ncbi:hypothetical protein [Pseudomonas oryzihabitans]|uniref:hypothetical protein n=1 Tax=Pseudomonas oryzihabitans TaxID=47885 RepID=UPI0011A8ED00|nr:hypothetical protein [Pseudomonas psychrotolerans]